MTQVIESLLEQILVVLKNIEREVCPVTSHGEISSFGDLICDVDEAERTTVRDGAVILCDFRSVPDKTECREMIWSEGKACKKCPRVDCYRSGWGKTQVDADNARLVKDKERGK